VKGDPSDIIPREPNSPARLGQRGEKMGRVRKMADLARDDRPFSVFGGDFNPGLA
jgi:hypothetical protein